MPALIVLNDAPEEVTLSGGKRTSAVQIAKTGTFSDPRYGKFAITSKDFSKWIDNFNALNKANGRLGLPVDVDHKPEKQGDTEAAGWITSLSVKAGGTELWATVEWNDLGVELVSNRRYAYISPSYVANFKDEQGKEHGTALLGVALTNRPFLSMATISLSKLHGTEVTESYTPDTTMDPKLLTALGLAADADEATVLAKIAELTTKSEPQTKTLAEQAKAEGMFVLTADQYASLSQAAAEGKAAADALKVQRFDTAFDKALNDPQGARVTPAQKEQFKTLYEGNADATIALLDGLPHLVNAEPVGRNDTTVRGEMSLSKSETEGFGTDDYSVRLAAKADEIMLSNKDMDYGDAVIMAASQIGS